MRIILYGTPVSYVFIGLNNLMRATGYPKKAMVSALLSVAVNLVLAPTFIFVFDWGISGAAWATVCGQTASFIWVLCHFMSKKSFIHFRRDNRWFNPSIIRRIYSIGLSPFLMSVCACIVVVFINRALLDYGGGNSNLAVGAYGIINRTTMFFVMIVFGVTQGMQPILGFNYGAHKWDRVKRTLYIGIWIGVGITFVGFAVCESFPRRHQPVVHHRRDPHHDSPRGIQGILHILPCGGRPDSDTEFLPVDRQAQDIHLPVAHAPAAVSDTLPDSTAALLWSQGCVGLDVRLRLDSVYLRARHRYSDGKAS